MSHLYHLKTGFDAYLVSTTSNITANKMSKSDSLQFQKSRIVNYSHLNKHDPDLASNLDDGSDEEDDDATKNCTENEDSVEDDEEYLSDHVFNNSPTTFQGTRVFDTINLALAKLYFIVNINRTKSIYTNRQLPGLFQMTSLLCLLIV